MTFWESSVFGIRVWTLTAALAALVAVGIAHVVLRWIIRRKVQRDEIRVAETPAYGRRLVYWLDRGLMNAIPPLALLLWTLGGYVAIAPVVDEWAHPAAPDVLRGLTWLRDGLTVVAFFWLLARVGRLIEAFLRPLPEHTANAWDDALLPAAGSAARVLLPLLGLVLGVQALSIPADYQTVIRQGLSLAIIGTVAYLLYQLVEAVEALVLQRYRMDVSDNLEARSVYTQVTVLKKVAAVIIGIFTLASMLMVFESVRQFGTSILASAGIAGIIIGFAAQRSIATLLAGLQIAITQPIRLDDVVIVENEWGRVEDITLTYVTVQIWDQRRLIVPITYFIEQPFQNWTRTSAEILGTVFLHVDYRVPLDAIRAEFERILRESAYWDGRVQVVQVTEARQHTLEIRALASAADASLAWDLRCEVREKLVAYLQREHPESLPRLRAELQAVEPAPFG
jgi:small-conductance mechanosensitive channel